MIFNKLEYLPFIIIGLGAILGAFLFHEKKFFSWVKDHFFFNRSSNSKFSSVCFSIGLLFLVISILDLRGPKETLSQQQFSLQRTLILIDSSSSMLVEDVSPNRFERALFLARHFIQNALNHQISIVLFSDNHKKIVPFTTDTQLMDGRLAGLVGMDINSAGSNIILSLRESLNYFENFKGRNSGYLGNVVLFTDGEDMGPTKLNLGDQINLLVVGVGSEKGGKIPIKDSRTGRFLGFKNHRNSVVVSKVPQNNLDQLGKISNHSLVVRGNTRPITSDALNFFSFKKESRPEQREVTLRPVYSYYLTMIGILFISLSFLLKLSPSFAAPIVLILIFIPDNQLFANTAENSDAENSEKERLLNELTKGRGNGVSIKRKLSELFLREKKTEEAISLLKEIEEVGKVNTKDKFNLGTAYLMEKKYEEALELFKNLKKDEESKEKSFQNSEFMDEINLNILKALKKKRGGGKGKGKGKSNDSNNKRGDNQNEEENKNFGKLMEPEKNKRPIEDKKVPGLIIQLLNKDRSLQKSFINPKTSDKRKKWDKKDW